jgi:hypothetical protein
VQTAAWKPNTVRSGLWYSLARVRCVRSLTSACVCAGHQQERDMIPLMMQKDYRPNGARHHPCYRSGRCPLPRLTAPVRADRQAGLASFSGVSYISIFTQRRLRPTACSWPKWTLSNEKSEIVVVVAVRLQSSHWLIGCRRACLRRRQHRQCDLWNQLRHQHLRQHLYWHPRRRQRRHRRLHLLHLNRHPQLCR